MYAALDAVAERDRAQAEAATERAGLVAAAIYNTHLKKGVRPFRPGDFVKRRPVQLTPEQMEAQFDAWAAAINSSGKVAQA